MVVARRGGCGGSCADVSAGASWLLILTFNGGAGTSMMAAGVAGEGGVRDGAVGCEKKMVAPPLLQIGGGRRGDGGSGCHGDGRRWRLGFGRLKVMTWQHVIS